MVHRPSLSAMPGSGRLCRACQAAAEERAAGGGDASASLEAAAEEAYEVSAFPGISVLITSCINVEG